MKNNSFNKTDRDTFIQNNLGLVKACAKRFINKGIEFDDLFSAGCMGIVKAYNAFDKTKGVKFSTYAVPVILGEIKRLFRDGGTIKVSRSIKELAIKIKKYREKFILKTGQEPKLSEIAKSLNVSVEQITQAVCALNPAMSLTENSNDESNGSQIELKTKEPDLKLADKIAVKEALNSLNQVDRKLIFMRYYCGNTQTETAKALNMTQVQVSRREKKILKILKTKLN